jgi:integration host factor subunit alpha
MTEPSVALTPDESEPDLELAFESLSTPTLTKAQLAEALFEQIGLNKREAKEMVEAFFDTIAARLIAASRAGEDGEEVKLAGFGNFRVRSKNPRPGRNPRTGELVPIAARRVITFHASPKLKERVQAFTPDTH